MGYLQPSDYVAYGLPADTTDDWITMASALIDSYCKRASLNPTQYEERLRITAHAQTVRLSYLPLVAVPPNTSPLISVQARYIRPRRLLSASLKSHSFWLRESGPSCQPH